ncbi:hypothetical protein [Pantoea ananatis]|uniref:hypothetical protein n=1 Tax=Pantoea TaxID=53335 RepID=UPI0023AF20C6|nr:hypothetical protein [Pantoea ananatis]
MLTGLVHIQKEKSSVWWKMTGRHLTAKIRKQYLFDGGLESLAAEEWYLPFAHPEGRYRTVDIDI